MLLVARVVQASGTAIMMPLLMTTIMTVVPAAIRGRMMGRVSVVISLAPAIGPTLAGVLLDTVGWRWIFGVVLPIALVALVIGARWIHNLGETTHAPIDVLSVILSALGFGGLVYGLSQIGAGGHGGGADAAAASAASTTTLIVSLTVGVIALGLFVWRQVLLQRKDDALLDLRVFRSRELLALDRADGPHVDGVLRRHHRDAAVPAGRARRRRARPRVSSCCPARS